MPLRLALLLYLIFPFPSFATVPETISGNIIKRNSEPANRAKEIQETSHFSCPPHFAEVPGNPLPGLGGQQSEEGTTAFCIAQFEMKHPTDVNGHRFFSREQNATPRSQPEHKPWVYISLQQAQDACARMRHPAFQFALINNAQWQTVARNIESTAANWRFGKMAKGHSDGSPPYMQDTSDVNDPYSNTENSDTSGWNQRRTHILSNGEVIWDLAGNAPERVTELKENTEARENFQINLSHALQGIDKLIFGPAGTYSSDPNFGSYCPNGAESLVRGGGRRSHDHAGIFEAQNIGASMDHEVGFRCVAYPLLP